MFRKLLHCRLALVGQQQVKTKVSMEQVERNVREKKVSVMKKMSVMKKVSLMKKMGVIKK